MRPNNRMKGENMEILDCGHPESEHSEFTRGYGTTADGKRHCYTCCADQDRSAMVRDGKIVLYLTEKGVTNWPGSLVFPVVHKRKGRHNMAGTRYDVWFTGPEGRNWHGVQYGENTQLCHCRRVKG